jgi:catechol 2,3-dioxygenase-like lactoylglutathione lyase family enzyme
MIDHVGIRAPDLDASRRFYAQALELLDGPDATGDADFVEWNDFSIAQATDERPVTRRLHVAFQASSREQVDAWWRAMTRAGYPDDGAPGPRPVYGPDYYGAFVTDPAGNSVEAIHNDARRQDGGIIDHLWVRVRNLDDSTRFYETIAPTVGHETTRHPHQTPATPARTRVHGDGPSFSVLEGAPTENLHLAFAAPDRETVRAFHHAGVAAGFRSIGDPGERAQYHPGYFGAYLADPDQNNIEAVFHDRG